MSSKQQAFWINAHEVRQRVTIVQVGVNVNGTDVTGEGSAVCDQHDEPDREIGYTLALGRALTELGANVKRLGWDTIHQHARDVRAEQERLERRQLRRHAKEIAHG